MEGLPTEAVQPAMAQIATPLPRSEELSVLIDTMTTQGRSAQADAYRQELAFITGSPAAAGPPATLNGRQLAGCARLVTSLARGGAAGGSGGGGVQGTDGSGGPTAARSRPRRRRSPSPPGSESDADSEDVEPPEYGPLVPHGHGQDPPNQPEAAAEAVDAADAADGAALDLRDAPFVSRCLAVLAPIAPLCPFDTAYLVRKLVRGCLAEQPAYEDVAEVVAGGDTQSRKSLYPVVQAVVGWETGVSTIIVTQLVAGRNGLFVKMRELVNRLAVLPDARNGGLAANFRCLSEGMTVDAVTLRKLSLHRGGAVVINDTEAQIKRIQEYICQQRGAPMAIAGLVAIVGRKFQLCIDEADAMQRSPEHADRENRTQLALKKMKGVPGYNHPLDFPPPMVVTYISATLLPVMLQLAMEADDADGADDVAVVYTNPEVLAGYVGIGDAVPLRDAHGADIFLVPEQATYLAGQAKHTLYTLYPGPVQALLLDVMDKENALLLDITSPRVTAEGNAYQEAKQCQQYVAHALGRELVAVVFHSRCIEVSLGAHWGWNELLGDNDRPVRDIVAVLKMLDEALGAAVPIAVFGYSQMIRGTSFRTDHRTPTHLACHLKAGDSLEMLVQAFGRVSGIGLQPGCKVLMSRADFDVARIYPLFLRAIRTAMGGGRTLREVLSQDAEYSAQFAILRETVRPIGNRRLGLVLPVRFGTGPEAAAAAAAAVAAAAAAAPGAGPVGAAEPFVNQAADFRAERRAAVVALLQRLRLDLPGTFFGGFFGGGNLLSRLRDSAAGRVLFPVGFRWNHRTLLPPAYMAQMGISISQTGAGTRQRRIRYAILP